MMENIFTLEDEPTTDTPETPGTDGATEGGESTPMGEPESLLEDTEKDGDSTTETEGKLEDENGDDTKEEDAE